MQMKKGMHIEICIMKSGTFQTARGIVLARIGYKHEKIQCIIQIKGMNMHTNAIISLTKRIGNKTQTMFHTKCIKKAGGANVSTI